MCASSFDVASYHNSKAEIPVGVAWWIVETEADVGRHRFAAEPRAAAHTTFVQAAGAFAIMVLEDPGHPSATSEPGARLESKLRLS